MTSKAFSNEYGFHWHYGWQRYVRTITPDNGSPPYEEDWSGGIIDGWTRRPDAPTRGNHRDPTEYGRSHVRMEFRQPQVIQRYSWLKIFEDLSTDAVSPGVPDRYYQLLGNAQEACNVKALNRLRGENTAQIGSSIGQARQTAEEIAGSTTSVVRALLAARKGNFAAAAKHLGLNKHSVANGTSAANAWLSMIYGWLPLMGDIHDSCNRLVNGYREESWPLRVTANEYVEYSEDYPWNGHAHHWECHGKVHYSYTFKIKNAFLDSLDGSGVLNPLSVAWELEPFSFVADWFVPVGNVLTSLSATAGLEFVRGFRRVITDAHLDVRSDYNNPYTIISPGWTTLDLYSMNRHVLEAFEPPSLYANVDPFKSSTRILNAVALIRQLF